MTRTKEQMQAAARLHALLNAASVELRVCADEEGWPIVPGKYGQLEWLGVEANGSQRLYVFSDRRNIIPHLKKIPGLHPCQIGETEARFWLAANDASTLRVVAKLVRSHRRRRGASPETLANARARATKALIKGTVTSQTVGMRA